MKKKILGVSLLSIIALLLTGCSNTEKTMSCERSLNQSGTKTSLNYTVTYKGDYVSKIKSVETVDSTNSTILESFKSQVENLYKAYDGIKYYDYNVDVKDNKLTSTVDINYEKVDTDRLIEVDSANGKLIKDGKIKIDDIKSVYEQLGATCK